MKLFQIIPLAFLIFSFIFHSCNNKNEAGSNNPKPDYVLVIHGGAGAISPTGLTSDLQQQYRHSLNAALSAGEKVLKSGGSATKAVISSILIMEDDSLFNSARGAVLTKNGHVELDASIMDGQDHNAGAVAGVKHTKNPILAAYKVMANSDHVMLSGKGADRFAVLQGLDSVSQDYFITQRRLLQLKNNIKGTVGAVALDKNGKLAAGTSTGGMSMKKWGRIGDSPVIGAGTWADNRSCAISATGHGEFFIRNVVAHDIHARMLYMNQTLEEASKTVIYDILLEKYNADGGLIGIDHHGNMIMEFNTSGMFRGYTKSTGETEVRIFK
ncbi:MAG: isoaspartyl peptidase/L-asparaginase [Bacteroidales bacterium]|nr:isoaspartyl peptidase/L-asparaginase [Bacteroidales bacterium]